MADSLPADPSDPFGAMRVFVSPSIGDFDTSASEISPENRNTEVEFKREERKDLEIGSEGVGSIETGFNDAPGSLGREEVRTLEDGQKRNTQYAVVPLDSILASHNETDFRQTEGFPALEDGRSPNDNDYQNSREAQENVDNISRNLDERIFQNIPVINQDGIIIEKKAAGGLELKSEFCPLPHVRNDSRIIF